MKNSMGREFSRDKISAQTGKKFIKTTRLRSRENSRPIEFFTNRAHFFCVPLCANRDLRFREGGHGPPGPLYTGLAYTQWAGSVSCVPP